MDDVQLNAGTEDALRRTPAESVFLAYAAMAPIAAGAVAFFVLHGDAAALSLRLTLDWAGAIVCFLAGVRRGLSFRQPGGPLLSELATMLWLFALGFASLAVPWAPIALALQILGFATLAISDPIAARRAEAPRYFARLRPPQMTIPLVSLVLLLAGVLWRS
jgi:hypothetical protein